MMEAIRGLGRRSLLVLLLVIAMAWVTSSCGGDDSDSSSDVVDAASDAASDAVDDAGDFATAEIAPTEPLSMEEGDAEETVEVGEASSGNTVGGSGAAQTSVDPADFGRDIIFTARLELASSDVSTATDEAIRTVEGLGGFVFSQESRGGAQASSVVVFKVLPDQFQTALDRLGAIGEVRAQSVSAEDVSALVVDLQSRITTAEASVERLRELIVDADLAQIAALENQLLERETMLERLRGQLRSVRDQVDLATITVTIVELTSRTGLEVFAHAYAWHDSGFACLDNPGLGIVNRGDAITVCYVAVNRGDTRLTDLNFDETELGVPPTAIVVDGSPDELAPGEQLVVAHEIEIDETVRLRASATAVAVDDDGQVVDPAVDAVARPLPITVETSGLPGFGDVLSGSWNALTTLVRVIAIAVVAILPFLPIVLVAWALLRWSRGRSRRDDLSLFDQASAAASDDESPNLEGS